jgi:predicted transcriptional regulator
MDDTSNPQQELLSLTTEIVAAFVGNNSMAAGDLPTLISSVFRSLSSVGQPEAAKTAEAPTPAVPIKKSVTPDFLVCLEDGKKFKTLKRHLTRRYNLTPDEYRRRWGLPADYPMVAPAYAARRSALAKPTLPPPAPEPAPAISQPPRRVGGRRELA